MVDKKFLHSSSMIKCVFFIRLLYPLITIITTTSSTTTSSSSSRKKRRRRKLRSSSIFSISIYILKQKWSGCTCICKKKKIHTTLIQADFKTVGELLYLQEANASADKRYTQTPDLLTRKTSKRKRKKKKKERKNLKPLQSLIWQNQYASYLLRELAGTIHFNLRIEF